MARNLAGWSFPKKENPDEPKDTQRDVYAGCPSCYSGKIIYDLKSEAFRCDKCGEVVVVETNEGKRVKAFVEK